MNSTKTVTKYLIIFGVVILIGLGSLISMLIYSFSDNGTISTEPIILENAEVQLYQNISLNHIKLDFYNVTENKTETYEVVLLDAKGKTLESLLITVELNRENMAEYIYAVKAPLSKVCFYKVIPVNG